jgi:hypothetical protein
MGRLTLNMLLSFAQFEREVTAERIRDKIAASKKKGLWMGGNVPLGYDPDRRTLRVNELEAETVRALFRLYETHGLIYRVKHAADDAGLVTKQRVAPDGTPTGGRPFTRGHIHHLLTNPIYAGRIRHKGQVHEGQHEAIVAPERWEAVQAMLQDGAARTRKGGARAKRKTRASLLVGKLYDETGDRLTPSHSKSKTGARLRYYVSHRLIARSGETQNGGWRLPAPELESAIDRLVRGHLKTSGAVLDIIPDCPACEIQSIGSRLGGIAASKPTKDVLGLVARAEIEPGAIAIALCPTSLAHSLEVDLDRITTNALSITAPFQTRKRGVETKIILNGVARPIDEILLGNIASAHAWYGMLKAGKTFAEISKATGTSKRRIQQMLDLAFLAPDIIRDVIEGHQPVGFTSDWCLRHDLPADWQAQRDLIATL